MKAPPIDEVPARAADSRTSDQSSAKKTQVKRVESIALDGTRSFVDTEIPAE
jgi:hypothetical protein